ncbi:DUF3179 domain-containing protein [Aurantimonas sp. A2-1-M11]|uniref:DUF3179 domain-containing protein n=1 Tax=Aurantimonas sp. A2-1-M11 TaxID=3113712 RepID=UPI002F94B8BC
MQRLSMLGVMAVFLGTFIVSTCYADTPKGWSGEWARTDFSEHAVPFDEILSGGPQKDGISSIDQPRFERIYHLAMSPLPNDPVMSVEINGDARAYTQSILVWHEIVNDTVGGMPLAVTYCPLCNMGAMFRRKVGGEAKTFGTIGKLRHSDQVMCARATESWWKQFDGRAIVDERTGDMLDRVPSRLESFRDFRKCYHDGLVLVPRDPAHRDYGRNPYFGHDDSAMPFLYRGDYDGPGTSLMRVVAVLGRDEAWSFDFLQKKLKVEVDDLVINWNPGQASAVDQDRIAEGRDVGTVTVQRHLAGGEFKDVAYSVPFAFAFRAFNPDAPIRHFE